MDLKRLNSNLNQYVCPFTPKLLEMAKKEVNENPETRNESIQDLYKTFCMNNPPELILRHNDSLTDPKFLLRFLRVAKFKINKAVERLEGPE